MYLQLYNAFFALCYECKRGIDKLVLVLKLSLELLSLLFLCQ